MNENNDDGKANTNTKNNDNEMNEEHNYVTEDEDELIHENEQDKAILSSNEIDHEYDGTSEDPLQNEPFLANDEEKDEIIDEDSSLESEEQDAENNNEIEPMRRSRRTNAGAGIERFEPRFGMKSYEITRKKEYMQYQDQSMTAFISDKKDKREDISMDIINDSYK